MIYRSAPLLMTLIDLEWLREIECHETLRCFFAAAELLVYLLLHFLIFRISQETGENDHAAKYRWIVKKTTKDQ